MKLIIDVEKILEYPTMDDFKSVQETKFISSGERHYIVMDKKGRCCNKIQDIMTAERIGTFPITIYRIKGVDEDLLD